MVGRGFSGVVVALGLGGGEVKRGGVYVVEGAEGAVVACGEGWG